MKILGPSPLARLNEVGGFVLLAAAVSLTLTFVSYYPQDPSWNTASEAPTRNICGVFGAHIADLLLQTFGFSAFLIPAFLLALAWNWVRSTEIEPQWAKLLGAALLFFGLDSLLGLGPSVRYFQDAIPAGGLAGQIFAEIMLRSLNLVGSLVLTSTCLIFALYLLTSFSIYQLKGWLLRPASIFRSWRGAWRKKREQRASRKKIARVAPSDEPALVRRRIEIGTGGYEIPIRTIDDVPAPVAAAEPEPVDVEAAEPEPAVVEYVPPPPAIRPPWEAAPLTASAKKEERAAAKQRVEYQLPATSLLNEPEGKSPYDAQELKEIAARIKSKFEEFNVLGTVTQINPGPVVTTFEYKPEAGIKYSRITTLTEDLCLGLQAESILIERIPGKPTVGIEVPNTRREVIALRAMLESEEFQNSGSKMTIALGKDVSGRIKMAALEAMPHLLIAGSTGSGKSVMLNSLIMSVLYKSTPHDVRMILIDPKRVEMGMYEGVPHLLTPVITDPRKATIALRNAVLEMERRLKLLASQGVRNIDQYNRKIRQKLNQPKSLFADQLEEEDLQPLSYILIVIDELADLMMIERGNVEESITRLAQMARAVGMHLVVATQRPSVDVITGLIKANFPARISFRVATRVDSRTILDVMGSEHLLGKGDMLMLPPGSARLVRVHAPYVTENEITGVVDFWKSQALADYDDSFLIAPPDADDPDAEPDDFSDFNDPMWEDAVRVVLEVGKASTSTLQRRLRLGYGRAARILDKMHHDGIIGPPDGSRPREVLKRPDWLDEVANTVP